MFELPRGHERTKSNAPPKAQWMSDKEIAGYRFDPERNGASILLGAHNGQWIGTADDRHLITVAGSRAGKSSTVLKPNLKLWPSSILCIDPKGELAMDTAKDRAAMGQDVFILDPFGEVKGEAAQWRTTFNPFDELRATDPDDVIDDAAMIAEALIVADGNKNDHWTMAAKNLIRGLTLYTMDLDPTEAALTDVRELVTLPMGDDEKTPDDDVVWLSTRFKLMMDREDAFDGVVAGVGGTMFGKPKGERGSIVSTAIEQTSFLDSKPMKTHLAQSGRLSTLRILKRKPSTIYLVLPASRMATHFRWFRLILTLALAAMEREPMGLDAPVLFILEEFPQLGYMRQIEAAAGLMAGYDVKLHTVLQDLTQIKALYKDSWETFIGNAGVVQAFGNTDATTLEYLSRMLGNIHMTETISTPVTASQYGGANTGKREQSQAAPLLAPFEIAQFCSRDSGGQIVKIAGKPPAYIKRLSHENVDNI